MDTYLEKFDEAPDATGLMMAMISDGITDPEMIRNFMLVNDYYHILKKNDNVVTLTLIQLSEKYALSERQIQNILARWKVAYGNHVKKK